MKFLKKLKSNFSKVISSNEGLTMVEVVVSFVIFMLALVMVTTSLRYALTTQDKYTERKEWVNMLLVNMYAEKANNTQDIAYSKNNIDFKLVRSADNTEACFNDMFSGTGGIGFTARYGLWNVKFDKDTTKVVFGLIQDGRYSNYSWSEASSGNLKYYDYNEPDESKWADVSIAVYSLKK
jgi:Tfp pilus assembly protein PilV